MLYRVAQALVVLGVSGFCGTVCLHYAGPWADRIELPVFFETTAIALPDGGRLTATSYTHRVQRYGADGRFRTGWFVRAEGGHFAIGLTANGAIAVYSASKLDHTRQVFFLFDLDGRPLGYQPSFTRLRNVGATTSALQPADFPSAFDIRLQPVVPVERPHASVVAILLAPLWDPFAAFAIFVVGSSILWWKRVRGAREKFIGASTSA
jgi:hypothetical protein